MRLVFNIFALVAIVGGATPAQADSTASYMLFPPAIPPGQIAVPVTAAAPVIAAPVVAAPLLAPYAAPVVVAPPAPALVTVPVAQLPQPAPQDETFSLTYPQYGITVNCIRRVSSAPAFVEVSMTANWVGGGAGRQLSQTRYSGDGTYNPEQIRISAERMMEDCKRGMEAAYRMILQELEYAARQQQPPPPAKTF